MYVHGEEAISIAIPIPYHPIHLDHPYQSYCHIYCQGLTNGSEALAEAVDALNAELPVALVSDLQLPRSERPMVISFSHFLPRQELIPEKRFQ